MSIFAPSARAQDKPAAAAPGGLHAVISTTKGDIRLVLYPDDCPVTVTNFCNLAERGYYDGLKFHRVIPNFMIQGGCPFGRGNGDPGYKFKDETTPKLKHDGPGILSMANSDPQGSKQPYSNTGNTNGSQFFITHKATPHLDGLHTVFGKLEKGQEVVNAIVQNDGIKSIKIEGDTKSLFEKNKKQLDEWNKILDQKFPKKKTPQEVLDESTSHLKSLNLDPAKFKKSDSGIWILDVKEGSGAQPQRSNKVKLYSTGYLANGTKFWSTTPESPMIHPAAGFVPGFSESVLGMKIGGKRVVVIPSNLAYGSDGHPGAKIPPNATLVYEIELLGVE